MLLTIPTIQPDEFIASWFFRIACINNIYNITRLKMELRRQAHITDPGEARGAIHLAAKILNIEPEIFSAEYTTFGDLQNGKGLHRKLTYGHLAAIYNLGINGGSVNICKECTHEDIAYHGYYYFRRSHQLPGVRICTKHMKKLKQITLASGGKYKDYGGISNYIKNITIPPTQQTSNLEIVYADLIEHVVREVENIDLNQLKEEMKDRLVITLSKTDIEWLQETNLEEALSSMKSNGDRVHLTGGNNGKELLLSLALRHQNSLTAYKALLKCRVKVSWAPKKIPSPIEKSNSLDIYW